MRTKYLVAALSAVALTACTNDEVMEVNRGRGITFQVATEASTRATATTTNNINEFKVWGYTQETPAKELMKDLAVTKTGNTWGYTGTIYWPAAAVDFYSVSPGNTAVSISSTSQTIPGFTVNTNQANQVDLLYAVNKGETKDATNSAVKINFRHALSQIVFKAKNTNENLLVKIKGVEIVHINQKGDFTYPAFSTTTQNTEADGTITANTQGTWNNVATSTTFAAGITEQTLDGVENTAVDLTTTNEDEVYTGALFMIPQQLTAWNPKTESIGNTTGVYFLVDCQMMSGTNKDVIVWPTEPKEEGAYDPDADGDGYGKVAIPASALTWEQGKKYVYTFIFGEGGGYIPDPEDPDPDPTLYGISFTVTVDNFINGFDPESEGNVDMTTGEE